MSTKREEIFSEDFLKEFDKRQKLDLQKLEDRKDSAMKVAYNIAQMLSRDFAAKQVYLYGSLAYGNFGEYSDIDLLVVGFQGNYWRALSLIEKMSEGIEVSLVCEEDAYDEIKKEIYIKGVELKT